MSAPLVLSPFASALVPRARRVRAHRVRDAGTAHADNSADEADLAFRLGNEAYGDRQYALALQQYFLSYRLVPNRNVLFNIARCFEALERYDEAYRYYHDLSSQKLGAQDRREVARSLQRIRPRVALVELSSEPPGADVYVDRVDLGSRGQTPLTLALPAGPHTIILQREGHEPAELKQKLVRGRELEAKLKLELITGTASISGTPIGAWVREMPDGPTLGTLPASVRLPPGRRILYVGADGHGTSQLIVDVQANGESSAQVALGPAPKPTGHLVVTANHQNAVVLVDGVEAGFTPAVLTLPEGSHEIEVSLPELTPLVQTFAITSGKEQRLHAELRYSPPSVKAASKSLLSVDEAPASISVITREEIQGFGYSTLAEALSAIRGFSTSNDRLYNYVGIRGFSPPGDLNTRVLILWDGHALNDIWAGQGYAGRELAVSLDEVDRIEIVRGPGSALYGTGAFFAVINVVPRDTLSRKRNVEATGGVGALGAWRGHLAAGMKGDDASVLFSGSAFGALGAEFTALGNSGLVRGLDDERAWNASARGRVGEVTLFAQLNNRQKQFPTAPFGTEINAPGTRSSDSRGFAEVRWDHPFADGSSLSLRGYYDASRYRGYWMYAPEQEGGGRVVYTDSGSADWAGTEARYRFSPFEGNFLTAGLEAQFQYRLQQEIFSAGDGRPLANHSRTLFSAYLLDEWRVHRRLFVSAGLRVDRYLDEDDTPVTPRLALILLPYENGITKLVAGQAFRAPNVYELHYHDELFSQRPAKDLSPESITTIEIEHAHDLTEELRLTVAGYHNRIHSLVVLEQEHAPEPGCGPEGAREQCLVYQNATGMLRAFGAEAGLRWQPGRHALVDASYSFVNLVGASPEVQSGTPVHLASGRLLTPLAEPFVRLSFQATYQSARKGARVPEGAGEALLLNVGLSGETEHLRYFAGVQNLLDVKYALPVGSEFPEPVVPQYGRTFSVSLTGVY